MSSILAIDANPFAIRAALVKDGVTLLDTLEAKPDQFSRVARFVGKQAREDPYMRVVGSPLDNWPHGLQAEIETEGNPMRWLSPSVARGVQHYWAPWQLRRRLLRARLLAYLDHHAAIESTYLNPAYHALRWERLMALESLQEIDSAAHHAGLYIIAPNPDF